MLEDLCFAISLLARHPGVMAEAIVALALGIGANITVFTLVDALLMRNPVTRVSITLVLAAVSMTASALPARWARGSTLWLPYGMRLGAQPTRSCPFAGRRPSSSSAPAASWISSCPHSGRR